MKKNETLIELLAGIIFLAVIAQIISVILSKDYLYNAVGLWSGAAIAVFMAIHLKESIEESLDLWPEDADRHYRSGYATRYLVAFIGMMVVIAFNLGNPLTLLVGIMTLKVSAYLQPQMHKLFLRFTERKNEKQKKK